MEFPLLAVARILFDLNNFEIKYFLYVPVVPILWHISNHYRMKVKKSTCCVKGQYFFELRRMKDDTPPMILLTCVSDDVKLFFFNATPHPSTAI